ncbi:MAG: type II toxin-antitoxin system VapC family toxin [Deltaproteobacteria bacterium]|nr:type II toxin-antitoxin system VapC family toxin [Deltaproteobacteria bacterium]
MIILDTHIWLWWINKDVNSLDENRINLINSSDIVAVSAISCFEVAWLDLHKRITLPCKREVWFEKALKGSGIDLMPITPQIATYAVELPEHHSDPQDRIIIATALSHNAKIMSVDKKFRLYKEIKDHLI